MKSPHSTHACGQLRESGVLIVGRGVQPFIMSPMVFPSSGSSGPFLGLLLFCLSLFFFFWLYLPESLVCSYTLFLPIITIFFPFPVSFSFRLIGII